MYNLPVDYTKLTQQQRREVRMQYIEEQKYYFIECSAVRYRNYVYNKAKQY